MSSVPSYVHVVWYACLAVVMSRAWYGNAVAGMIEKGGGIGFQISVSCTKPLRSLSSETKEGVVWAKKIST